MIFNGTRALSVEVTNQGVRVFDPQCTIQTYYLEEAIDALTGWMTEVNGFTNEQLTAAMIHAAWRVRQLKRAQETK